MNAINPTNVWLSDHILLSDLIGCDSVYRYGIPNPIFEEDKAKIEEGEHLADTLEPYVKNHAISFTYGYISPGLSRAIVKYQNPNKKSYHRWDNGAACDMVSHGTGSLADDRCADPSYSADIYGLNRYPLEELYNMYRAYGIHWSRAITYAESEIFCFATRSIETPGKHRMATYENRYMGPTNPKPDYRKVSPENFQRGLISYHSPEYHWHGRGWPHTHGGGRRQYEHVRTGQYSVLSDFLYDPICTHKGIPNKPPLGRRSTDKFMLNVFLASLVYEKLLHDYEERIPIVAAYVNPVARKTKEDRSYQDRFVFDLRTPRNGDVQEIASVLDGIEEIRRYKILDSGGRIRVWGYPLDDIPYPKSRSLVRARYGNEREHFKRGMKL